MTLGALGGASYILYLIHLPLSSVLSKLLLLPALRPLAGSTFTFPLSVAAAVAISISMHYGIERPALRWLRRRFPPGSRSSNVITTTSPMMPKEAGNLQ
jgi:exopolysaccharide production protein ExoZ